MTYRFSDKSPEAKRWRMEQMIANFAISGREMEDPAEFIALIEKWEAEGLSQDEKAARLTEIAKGMKP